MNASNKLREARTRENMTQLRLGSLTGIAPNIISCIESGKLPAYPNWRKKICAALGANETEIFPNEKEV